MTAPLESMVFDIRLQPKERQFLRLLDGPESLFGFGGARGGAKSHALRSAAIVRRFKYPGTRALIFRRTYDQLWQQHIQMIIDEWPELYRRFWSAENKALMLPGHGMILFRYGDTLKDILEFKGKEFGDVFIDEATDLSEQELKILYTCCRSTVRGFEPKKALTFNPGGIGHGYVKRAFVDRQLTAEEDALGVRFLQSYAWDNIMWVRDPLKNDGIPNKDYYRWPTQQKIDYLITRSSYGRELNALPAELRDAWLWGKWDVFVGQAFSEWWADVHICDPFAIPVHWLRWRSVDPGYTDPAAWLWYAVDEKGQCYVYREATHVRITDSEQGRDVRAKSVILDAKGKPVNEQFIFTAAGMDAFISNPESGKSPVGYYMEGGLDGFIRCIHGPGSRAQRARVVHEYLRRFTGPDGRPTARIKIFRTCRKLIETLPTLINDVNDPEAVESCGHDHWYDSFSYGLAAWHSRRSEPQAKTFPRGSLGDLYGTPKTLADDEEAKRLEREYA